MDVKTTVLKWHLTHNKIKNEIPNVYRIFSTPFKNQAGQVVTSVASKISSRRNLFFFFKVTATFNL